MLRRVPKKTHKYQQTKPVPTYPAYHHFAVMEPESRGESHGTGVGAAAVGGALAVGVEDVDDAE
jgi:hypothetical protein